MEEKKLHGEAVMQKNESEPIEGVSMQQEFETELIPVIEDARLTSKQKVAQIAHIVGIMQEEAYSGPIPPPAFLRDLKTVMEDGPERVFKMAENQQTSIFEGQTESLKQNKINIIFQFVANIISLLASISIIVFCSFIGYKVTIAGHDAVGGVIFGTTIVGVVTLFITGKLKKSDRDNE